MEPWLIAKYFGEFLSRRQFLRNSAVGLAGLTVGLQPPAAWADGNERLLVDRVRRSIDRGIQFLRDQEDRNGHWELDAAPATSRPGGETCLALLALLNAGVKPDDPIIERGLKYLRNIGPRDTYVVGLQTMVFAAAGKDVDAPLIHRNVQWLIDARVMDGKDLHGWTYNMGGVARLGPGMSDNSNTQYALL